MFSVITLIPSVVESSAHICACMSVGKPGYGSVINSSGLVIAPLGETEMEFLVVSTLKPDSVRAVVTAVTCSG